MLLLLSRVVVRSFVWREERLSPSRVSSSSSSSSGCFCLFDLDIMCMEMKYLLTKTPPALY